MGAARAGDARSPAVRRWAFVAGVTALLFLLATAWLLIHDRHESSPADTRVVVARAADPSAVAAMSGGGFRYAERRTGRIREVDRSGQLLRRPVATVQVRSTPGQRGLLGIAVDRASATFAAWTRRSDGRLVVGQVAPGPMRLVWVGPISAGLANGGRLAFAPDGRLVIGIGDLERPDRSPDPASPNGKLLALDPGAAADQTPRLISQGWNNPYSFTSTPDGSLWLADNAPGRRPERIGRGDRHGAPVATTGSLRPLAPSALVALGQHRLGLCGYVSRTMREVRLDGDQPSRPGRVLIDHCAIAAAVLSDGRVVVTDDETIRLTKDALADQAARPAH